MCGSSILTLHLEFPQKRNKVRGSRKVEVRKRNAALVYENVVQYWCIVEITTHVMSEMVIGSWCVDFVSMYMKACK